MSVPLSLNTFQKDQSPFPFLVFLSHLIFPICSATCFLKKKKKKKLNVKRPRFFPGRKFSLKGKVIVKKYNNEAFLL